MKALLILLGCAVLGLGGVACTGSESVTPPAADVTPGEQQPKGPTAAIDPDSVPIQQFEHVPCAADEVEARVRTYMRERWATEFAPKRLVKVDIFNCFPESNQLLLTLHKEPQVFVPPPECQDDIAASLKENKPLAKECQPPDTIEFLRIEFRVGQ